MNIIQSFNLFGCAFFSETPTYLTIQQKKVSALALAFLGLLVVALLVCRTWSWRNSPSKVKAGEATIKSESNNRLNETHANLFFQPKIIQDSWGEITLEMHGEQQKFKDVVIVPSDLASGKMAEEWNWRWQTDEKGQSYGLRHVPGIRIVDVEHFILSKTEKIDVIILSQGRGHGGLRDNPGPGILQIEPNVEEFLKKKGFEVHVLKTADAIDLYQKLTHEDKKRVAALIHTTC